MNTPTLALVLSAALSACTSTPTDIKNYLPPTRYTSALAPASVINCMTRNELHSGFAMPTIVTTAPDGTLEFSLRGGDNLLHLYAEVRPSGQGSGVAVYAMSTAARKKLEATIIKGC